MPHLGYDIFYPQPGKYGEMKCRVCDATCNVERDREGATCFAQAMSGRKSKHNRFTCPNSGAEWHEHVIDLMKERDSLKTKRLRKMVEEEIEEVLYMNIAEKKIDERLKLERERK